MAATEVVEALAEATVATGEEAEDLVEVEADVVSIAVAVGLTVAAAVVVEEAPGSRAGTFALPRCSHAPF